MSVCINNIILSLQAASKQLCSTARIASWTSSGCCLMCHFLCELLLNINNKLDSFAIFKVECRFEWQNWPLKFWVASSQSSGVLGFAQWFLRWVYSIRRVEWLNFWVTFIQLALHLSHACTSSNLEYLCNNAFFKKISIVFSTSGTQKLQIPLAGN